MDKRFDELLTTPQVCAFLGITRDTLYEWREVHTAPPALKLPNGHLRFVRSELLAWLADQRRAA
jgi:excisionase family DNA binding protein